MAHRTIYTVVGLLPGQTLPFSRQADRPYTHCVVVKVVAGSRADQWCVAGWCISAKDADWQRQRVTEAIDPITERHMYSKVQIMPVVQDESATKAGK